MKNIIQGVVLTGALVLGGTAFAQTKATPDKGTAEYQGFVVPSDAKSFLERVHYANQAEIKQAQLAQKNSMNEDVKAFAAQMEKEHTSADQKVMDLAKAQNLKLADMPKPMNDVEKKAMAADKAAMDKLQALKGAPFDGCYMSGQLGEHDSVLGKLMAGKQAMAGNAEASALISELITNVSMHRQHAYALLGKLSPAGDKGADATMPATGTTGGAMGGTTGTTGGTMGGTTGGTMGTKPGAGTPATGAGAGASQPKK